MLNVLEDLAMFGVSGSQVKVLGNSAVINCIFHTEKTPSLSISLDGTSYNCFGCGAHGSYRKFQKIILPNIYDQSEERGSAYQHLVKIENSMNILNAGNTKPKISIADKIENINLFETNGSMAPWQWDWRGLNSDFLKIFNAKYWLSKELNPEKNNFVQVPRIYFPFKHKKYNFTIGYAARRLDNETYKDYPKYRNSSLIPTKDLLYLSHLLIPKSVVVIVEGAVDALSLINKGIPAVAALGTNQWSDYKTRLVLSKSPRMVISMGDGDEAGTKFNHLMRSIFQPLIKNKFYLVDLSICPGLDPGSFDDAWFEYLRAGIEEALPGELDKVKKIYQNKIEQNKQR